MDNAPSALNNDPRPVLELSYLDRRDDLLRGALRTVVWLFIIFQAANAGYYVLHLGCYLFEQADPVARYKYLRITPLIVGAPGAILAMYLIVNCGKILRLSVVGRRWIMYGAAAQAVLKVVYDAVLAFEVVFVRKLLRSDVAYGTQYTLDYVIGGLWDLIVYLLIWSLFKSQTVLELEAEPSSVEVKPSQPSEPATSSPSALQPPDRNSDSPSPSP